MFRISFCILGLFLVSACAGSAYKLPKVTESDVQAMTEKYEEKTAAPLKIYKRTDKQNKNTLQAITKKLTQNTKPLCEHTGYSSCYFEVYYNPDDTVNAYASEGYKITIHKGLLQYLKNNDEIAAVVAHEMGHHLANHNEEKLQNAKAGAAVSGLLTAVLLGVANSRNPYYNPQQQQRDQQTIADMMKVGAHVGALSYSKEQEQEADLLATYILDRAGYNLKKAQNVMVVLAQFAGEKNVLHAAFLDSHPAGMERVAAWEKAIEEIKENSHKLPYRKQEESAEALPAE